MDLCLYYFMFSMTSNLPALCAAELPSCLAILCWDGMGRYRLGFAWLVSGGQARELDRDQDGRITSDDFLLLEEKCFGSALEVNALAPLSTHPLISGRVHWSIGPLVQWFGTKHA